MLILKDLFPFLKGSVFSGKWHHILKILCLIIFEPHGAATFCRTVNNLFVVCHCGKNETKPETDPDQTNNSEQHKVKIASKYPFSSFFASFLTRERGKMRQKREKIILPNAEKYKFVYVKG